MGIYTKQVSLILDEKHGRLMLVQALPTHDKRFIFTPPNPAEDEEGNLQRLWLTMVKQNLPVDAYNLGLRLEYSEDGKANYMPAKVQKTLADGRLFDEAFSAKQLAAFKPVDFALIYGTHSKPKLIAGVSKYRGVGKKAKASKHAVSSLTPVGGNVTPMREAAGKVGNIKPDPREKSATPRKVQLVEADENEGE